MYLFTHLIGKYCCGYRNYLKFQKVIQDALFGIYIAQAFQRKGLFKGGS